MHLTESLLCHAADTLNDLVGDFVSGVMLLRGYHAQAANIDKDVIVTVHKMCLSHLVLGLAKFQEFNKRFCKVIPSEHRGDAKGLVRKIEEKGIVDFRNKCVGHIWDNAKERPLVHSEIVARLNQITGNDLGRFLRWVNDPDGNIYPATVVSIVEAIRDAIMRQHSISPDEFIER